VSKSQPLPKTYKPGFTLFIAGLHRMGRLGASRRNKGSGLKLKRIWNLICRASPLTHHPSIFSTGSPYNVPAGSQANLDELMAHYKQEANAAQAKRERKARAIYEGRESEESRFPDLGRVKPEVIPGGSTY